MSIKLNMIFAIMTVAGIVGCGYNSSTRDGMANHDASAAETDIAVMKDTAISSLANGIQPVVNAGGGCIAELTIDPALQRIVPEVLARYADTNDTGVGWAVLMSADDGAVLALGDCGGVAEDPHPFALTRLYTPGHLLSTMTVAAALDAGIATPDSELFTNASEAFYHQYKLPGDGSHIWESTLSVSNALAYSSNVVLSKLGILVGRDKEYDVLSKFGVGTKSGIGFSGERVGRLLQPGRWCSHHKTRIPIGQGVEITSIQVARAYATLANHGERVDPYAVKRIVNASGETVYEYIQSTNKVQAVSRDAANSTCGILEGAVNADDLKGFNGFHDKDSPELARSLVPPRATGRRAAVQGVRIAGKTSTVHRMKRNSSFEYDLERYTASFAGFFPADAPKAGGHKYVLVVCYETRRVEGVPYMHQGGGRPAIAFSEIVKSIVRQQGGPTQTCCVRESH